MEINYSEYLINGNKNIKNNMGENRRRKDTFLTAPPPLEGGRCCIFSLYSTYNSEYLQIKMKNLLDHMTR